MQLISEDYREQNRRLHEAKPNYGTVSAQWVPLIDSIARCWGCESILDYGCGKGAVRAHLGERVREYDPAIIGKDAPPQPADLVVCTDVLEHVEPDCLDAVLDDLCRLAGKVAFLVVSTRPATKALPDGRNAHLIVESGAWWISQAERRPWRIATSRVHGPEVHLLCVKSAGFS